MLVVWKRGLHPWGTCTWRCTVRSKSIMTFGNVCAAQMIESAVTRNEGDIPCPTFVKSDI